MLELDETHFSPANLQKNLEFWENEILAQHPHKDNLLKWIKGVRIEEFLNSFTEGEFQGIHLHSYYPTAQQFPNYVPPEFAQFMYKDQQVQSFYWNGIKLKKKDNLISH